MWAKVQEAAEETSSLAWIDHLDLLTLRGNIATIAPRPSKREAIRFVENPSNRQKLVHLISAAAGQPIELRYDKPKPAAHDARSETNATRPRQADVQDALSSPAVKLALEVFPDATIMNIHRHQQPPPEPTEKSADGSNPTEDPDV
ncbi:MAG: hypothetical protein RIG82_03985 [Phycisphaeraceae bacterium]